MWLLLSLISEYPTYLHTHRYKKENEMGTKYTDFGASLEVLGVKNQTANAGNLRDMGSVPGSRTSPGRGHGNPLEYSCLENSVDTGAWWPIVHGVAKSQT